MDFPIHTWVFTAISHQKFSGPSPSWLPPFRSPWEPLPPPHWPPHEIQSQCDTVARPRRWGMSAATLAIKDISDITQEYGAVPGTVI